MAAVNDVAEYIEQKLGKLSSYKLQKLVYYAQAWSLAWTDATLFDSPIKAWEHGPVAPALWHDRKEGVHGRASRLRVGDRETVDAVLEFYGAMSADDLIQLSHREDPWRAARSHGKKSAPISHAAMRAYYRPLATRGKKQIPRALHAGVRLLLSTPEADLPLLFMRSDVAGGDVLAWLTSGKGDPWDERSE